MLTHSADGDTSDGDTADGDTSDGTGYDALSTDVLADPYEHYSAFQRGCPVHRQSLAGEGGEFVNQTGTRFEQPPAFYQLFAYRDIMAVLQDHRLYSSAQGPGPDRLVPPNGVGMLIYADPPHHTRQRSLINKALTPRRVATLEPRVRELANALVDDFAGAGHADLIADFAAKLPGAVFCEMLGAEPAEEGTFLRWTEDIASSFSGDPQAKARSIVTMQEFASFFTAQIEARRAAGGKREDDLISALVFPPEDAEPLSDLELILALQILLVGGHDTTRDTIAIGLHLLCTHPDQYRLLLEQPALLPAAIEEIMRFDSQPNCLFRTNAEDVEIAGVPIAANSKIGVMYGAGNRDPEMFEQPDRFDITRDYARLRRQLSFGAGIHACVGSALARMVMAVAFEVLLGRLPNLRLDAERPPVRADNLIARRYATMPLCWDVLSGDVAAPAPETG